MRLAIKSGCMFLPSSLGRQRSLHHSGAYTVMDRVDAINYRIKLIGSSFKNFVVHHNLLKLRMLWYTTATYIPSSSTPSSNRTSKFLYSDVVRCSTKAPSGGYTSSTNNLPPDSHPYHLTTTQLQTSHSFNDYVHH